MKLRKAIAFLLAAMMLCAGIAASAEKDFCSEQIMKHEEMKERKISVCIRNSGSFTLRASRLYGRQIQGVGEDGSFILGPWECVDSRHGMDSGSEYTELPGTYVIFAYSVDVRGGTHWPFSGVFWRNVNEPVESVTCKTGGGYRNVSVDILVNQKTVYSCENCDPHSEWKP